MRVEHPWFTERASLIWRGQRGRSMLGLIPSGCNESEVAKYIAAWLKQAFRLPPGAVSSAIARIVPDQNTSSIGFLSQATKAFEKSANISLSVDWAELPSQIIESVACQLQEASIHPIIVIERFHSFAIVADDLLLSLLSSMRSLEHASLLTTIALSPDSYEAIRRSVANTLPFVNSAYGDNHDLAVMSPLRESEFVAYATSRGLSTDSAKDLYQMGGGPDIVYQSLVDEYFRGTDDIVHRCASSVGGAIDRFLSHAIGPLQDSALMLQRLISRTSTASDIAFIKSLPQRYFLSNETTLGMECRGEILRLRIADKLAQLSNGTIGTALAPQDGLSILIISANSLDYPLDIEGELRSMAVELERTIHGRRISVYHCQAARADDIILALRRHQPQVVHFSGHGNQLGIELRTDRSAESRLVLGTALAAALTGRAVRVAVFNSCVSSGYATSIAQHVDAVVATKSEVSDESARRFTLTFYRTIAEGFTVEEAFKDACDAILLYNLENVFELWGDGQICLIGESFR
jgi:CHAT domain